MTRGTTRSRKICSSVSAASHPGQRPSFCRGKSLRRPKGCALVESPIRLSRCEAALKWPGRNEMRKAGVKIPGLFSCLRRLAWQAYACFTGMRLELPPPPAHFQKTPAKSAPTPWRITAQLLWIHKPQRTQGRDDTLGTRMRAVQLTISGTHVAAPCCFGHTARGAHDHAKLGARLVSQEHHGHP